MRGILILSMLTMLLAGCKTVRYETRPPTSDAGRACVTQCSAIKETCRGNEIRRSRMELESCEKRAEQSVRYCLTDADTADKKKKCENSRSGCYRSEDTERCEFDYRKCFENCGGTVRKIVEDR